MCADLTLTHGPMYYVSPCSDPYPHKSPTTQESESRRDQEEGGELNSHEEVGHFCGSTRDQEEGGGAGVEGWTSFASVVS